MFRFFSLLSDFWILFQAPWEKDSRLQRLRPGRSAQEDGSKRGRPNGAIPVSVIIPCRDERENIFPLIQRIPRVGSHTEIILVEGNSQDQTLEECYEVQRRFPEKDIQVLVQDGIGKADAIRKGCQVAKGAVLVLFDADLTVAPEEIPRMVDALVKGEGDLVIGNRFSQPMEMRAMPWVNYLGNQVFSRLFTLLIERPIRDTLCGAKALWKDDYHRIDSHRKEMGSCDPFGDFDLLLGAKRWNLKILEVPVRYRSRRYGNSKIHRFRHGALLLQTLVWTSMKWASSVPFKDLSNHPP